MTTVYALLTKQGLTPDQIVAALYDLVQNDTDATRALRLADGNVTLELLSMRWVFTLGYLAGRDGLPGERKDNRMTDYDITNYEENDEVPDTPDVPDEDRDAAYLDGFMENDPPSDEPTSEDAQPVDDVPDDDAAPDDEEQDEAPEQIITRLERYWRNRYTYSGPIQDLSATDLSELRAIGWEFDVLSTMGEAGGHCWILAEIFPPECRKVVRCVLNWQDQVKVAGGEVGDVQKGAGNLINNEGWHLYSPPGTLRYVTPDGESGGYAGLWVLWTRPAHHWLPS